MSGKFDLLALSSEISVANIHGIEEQMLQTAITEFAQHLRAAGHAESAHFMDIAALALEDPKRH